MVFCERSEEEQAKGFGKLLSNKDNLMLMCLMGDVLFLLKVFQKKLQGDDITIVDIVAETKKFIAKIDKLQQRPILGGWEDEFSQSYDEENETFFGRVLWQKERRSSRRNLNVSETRAFSAIRSRYYSHCVILLKQGSISERFMPQWHRISTAISGTRV